MQDIYQNKFGEIYSDRISLLILNKKHDIPLKNIIKIRFIKRKTFSLNYAVLLTALIIFNILKSSRTLLILSLIISILTLICFHLKLNQHKVIIIRKNDFLKIDVDKKLSKDAENLIHHLKQLHQL
ncbi:hypothetical protein FLCH110379_23005 [Flavobacterium chungbukense]